MLEKGTIVALVNQLETLCPYKRQFVKIHPEWVRLFKQRHYYCVSDRARAVFLWCDYLQSLCTNVNQFQSMLGECGSSRRRWLSGNDSKFTGTVWGPLETSSPRIDGPWNKFHLKVEELEKPHSCDPDSAMLCRWETLIVNSDSSCEVVLVAGALVLRWYGTACLTCWLKLSVRNPGQIYWVRKIQITKVDTGLHTFRLVHE